MIKLPEILKAKLAEWYGFNIKHTDIPPEAIETLAYYSHNQFYCKVTDWHPEKNSNQLDLLWDKVLEEIKTNNVIQEKYDELCVEFYVNVNFTLSVLTGSRHFCLLRGEGKTFNQARLSAIINFIEAKK